MDDSGNRVATAHTKEGWSGLAAAWPRVVAGACLACAQSANAEREYGGFHTPERIANLRANCEKYDWAKAQRSAAITTAERWVKIPDDEIWGMVPGQDLPRGIDVNMQNGVRTGGCPNCGPVIYERSKYPFDVDVWGKPWKITCQRCKDSFPKNDFGKYYRSGIDEHGLFNPKKADRSLLFNEDHPDPNDPKHNWCVDDGWGWNPEPGKVNRFVGYYAWKYWGELKGGVAALATAYLCTDDARYAHTCGVLLDRIADVYPAMDWSVYGKQGWFHSGSTDGGKIEGSIWECGTVSTLATAYDKVKSGLWEQPSLYAFLAGKARQYTLPTPKGTYEQLVGNIEANMLEEFVKAVKSGRKIYGNEGGPQANVVECAVALNREPKSTEWLDWIFKEGTVGQGATRPGEGGHVPALIVGTIDRDGAGCEGAPGYSLSWGGALGRAADLLADYGKYTNHDIYRDYPQFKRTITVGWRLAVLAHTTPNIGDQGACGNRIGIVGGEPSFTVIPTLGYRELWGGWPKSVEWEDNTISHNTVVINDNPQTSIRVGTPEFFAQFPDFAGFSADSREVYPGTAQTYCRTMALVKMDGTNASYALDIFRVEGGKDHVLSFHAIPGPVTAAGLALAKQEKGSYDGLDVPYGTSKSGPRMGYSWLDNVERDPAPRSDFVLDFKGTPPYWQLKAEDDLHLRYHCFTKYDDVALADGYPPTGQAQGQPPKLRYLLAHRAGPDGLATTNVAVIEPFLARPLIKQATRLSVRSPQAGAGGGLEPVALRIELADGAVDYLLSGTDDATVYETEEGLTFSGRLLALRVRAGAVAKAWLVRGAKLAWKEFTMALPAAVYRGPIVKMDREMKSHACVWVDTPLPTNGSLNGAEIIIANDRKLNACYTIEKVEQDGKCCKVDCGEVCFIRGFKDNRDYGKGYVYNFDEGAAWVIPAQARFERP